MHIWVGCRLPEDFEKALRAKCLEENRFVGLDTRHFCLPQHISLKISFPTDWAGEVLSWLRAYLSQQEAFSVTMERMERIPGVLWLKVAENPVLDRLHAALDARLEEKFGVLQHELDKCFCFHCTLFLDEDGEKLEKMAARLRSLPLPQTLQVDTFLLGLCPDGDPGGYQVVAEIPAKKQ